MTFKSQVKLQHISFIRYGINIFMFHKLVFIDSTTEKAMCFISQRNMSEQEERKIIKSYIAISLPKSIIYEIDAYKSKPLTSKLSMIGLILTIKISQIKIISRKGRFNEVLV